MVTSKQAFSAGIVAPAILAGLSGMVLLRSLAAIPVPSPNIDGMERAFEERLQQGNIQQKQLEQLVLSSFNTERRRRELDETSRKLYRNVGITCLVAAVWALVGGFVLWRTQRPQYQ